MKENQTQPIIRVEAAKHGIVLYRNNVGVAYDERDVPVRFGLANESAQINEKIKSSDLIGITPVLIRPHHVGCCFGVFTSIECKHGDWVFRGTKREKAQQAWIDVILRNGGIAMFATNPETVLQEVSRWR